MIILPSAVRRAIAAHAETAYPDECVGLLIGSVSQGQVAATATVAAANAWEAGAADEPAHSRRDRFVLDPQDYLRADQLARASGLDVVGCYHSHPDHPPIPSSHDLDGARAIGAGSSFAFVIQSVRAGAATELSAWRLAPDGTRFVALELRGEQS